MGLSSLPTPSENALALVLVSTAVAFSVLKEFLRSVLELLRLRAPTPVDMVAGAAPEPTLADRFRSRSRPVRFGSAVGRRRTADCRVCLCRFEPESVVNRLPCGHLFHMDCLERWLDYRHATCPLCRSHVLQGSASGVVFSSPRG